MNEATEETLHLGRSGDEPFAVPRDALARHVVCVGSTGSGKTALCLALLEEAAARGVPIIALDPKGDVANLLLALPPTAEALAPWVDERRVRAAGGDRALAAAREAARWSEGLRASGVAPERLAALRAAVDIALFTPGSDAARPLSLLGDLGPPAASAPEAQRERAQTTAAALLALAGVAAEAGRSREHVLLTTLLLGAWAEGQSMELPALIAAVQRPPFASLGALDLEAYYPAAERFELVLSLNHLLASPGALQAGEPLSIEALLASPDGRPRVSILSVAHLADHERSAFVTSLLGRLVSWARGQHGGGGLRALLFLDEATGYLPPVANPPTKGPLLTLFKQGRAQGLGVVVATQNPADLDYKALSNAGTWLVGRLATARDRQRVREALEGSDSGGAGGEGLDATLASLQTRQFLCHSYWGDPRVFEARWPMSYLRGPLSLDELRRLSPSGPARAVAVEAAARPVLPPGVKELFAPASEPASYAPCALALARVSYRDAAHGVDATFELTLTAPLPEGSLAIDWGAAARPAIEAGAFDHDPAPGARFAALPAGALSARAPREWQRALASHLGQHEERSWWWCEAARLLSGPGEGEATFRGRLGPALSEATERELAALRRAGAPRRKEAEDRVRRAEQALQRRKERAAEAGTSALLNAGALLLGGLLKGRPSGAKAVRAVKDAARVKHAGNEIDRAGDDMQAARDALARLEAEQAQAERELRERLRPGQAPLERVTLRPGARQIEVLFVGVGWLPATP